MHHVAQLFASQDGFATTVQLRSMGVSDWMIARRVDSGEWTGLGGTLVSVVGAPTTWRARLRCALLSAGDDAAVSGETAARLHGFDGFDRSGEIHLTTLQRRHHTARAGVHLHRSRLLQARHCIGLAGMRTVIRPVALLQVAGSLGPTRAAQALDGMLRNGDNPIWIRGVVSEWQRPGVTGPKMVIELLDERVDGALPGSWFQRLTKRVLAARRIEMVDEHPVYDADGALLARLDLAIPDLRIGVECQSWRWHASPSARVADARRKRRLRLLGWELVEVWWSDLERAEEVAEEIVYLITHREPAGARTGTRAVSRRGGIRFVPSR